MESEFNLVINVIRTSPTIVPGTNSHRFPGNLIPEIFIKPDQQQSIHKTGQRKVIPEWHIQEEHRTDALNIKAKSTRCRHS